MGFSYNSFKRYKFETFTTKKECISLKSVITEPKRTTLMVVVDQYNKFIKLYQDGELIDEHEYEGRLLRYDKEKFIYLGQTPSITIMQGDHIKVELIILLFGIIH